MSNFFSGSPRRQMEALEVREGASQANGDGEGQTLTLLHPTGPDREEFQSTRTMKAPGRFPFAGRGNLLRVINARFIFQRDMMGCWRGKARRGLGSNSPGKLHRSVFGSFCVSSPDFSVLLRGRDKISLRSPCEKERLDGGLSCIRILKRWVQILLLERLHTGI